MRPEYFYLLKLGIFIGVIFFFVWPFVSFSPRNRKKVRFIYFLPLIVYVILTTVFARQIVNFIGPCKIEVLYGNIGETVFYWVYPSVNIMFLILYGLTVLLILTHWEVVIKYGENTPYITPFSIFFLFNLINIFRIKPEEWSVVAPPLICWLTFMLITIVTGITVVIYDVKKAFQRHIAARRQKRRAEAGPGKKRLLLVYPISRLYSGLSVRSYSTFPPLSLGILSALTPRDQFSVALVDEQFERFSYREADLVAITAFTTYAPRAYEIATVYRKKGIPVVMGGIHASMRTEEALQYVDSVVVGEAEEIWPTVLADFLNNALQPVYQGTFPELKNMVVPDRELFDAHYVTNSIQTSRGCPWNCKYCSVAAFNGRRYRQRPVEEILDEIETIPNRYLFFVDDNLIGYSRAAERRALALFQGMVKRKIKKRWITQTTIDIGNKPELLKWAARSGCMFFFVGLEFIDKGQLQNMGKEIAMRVDYEAALKRINRHGIGVIGAFIYGSDDETREKMVARADFIIRNRIDVMQQSKLTAFPGTRIFHQLQRENRLFYTDYPADWEKYDFYALTHQPLGMTREEFIRCFRECVLKTYTYFVIWKKALKTYFHTRDMETAAAAMRANLSYRALSVYHIRNQMCQEASPEKEIPLTGLSHSPKRGG